MPVAASARGKGMEDRPLGAWLDPLAAIAHGQCHAVGRPPPGDGDRPRIAAMLNGVGQQVEQDVMQQAGIDADQRQAGGNLKVDGMAAEQILEVMDDTRDHIGQVHRRSEEHTSELQSLMRISYAVFGSKKKKKKRTTQK